MGAIFGPAAEIMRDYSGWQAEDMAKVPLNGGKVLSATRISLSADSFPIVDIQIDGDYMQIKYDESPVFISIQD